MYQFWWEFSLCSICSVMWWCTLSQSFVVASTSFCFIGAAISSGTVAGPQPSCKMFSWMANVWSSLWRALTHRSAEVLAKGEEIPSHHNYLSRTERVSDVRLVATKLHQHVTGRLFLCWSSQMCLERSFPSDWRKWLDFCEDTSIALSCALVYSACWLVVGVWLGNTTMRLACWRNHEGLKKRNSGLDLTEWLTFSMHWLIQRVK